MVPYTTNSAGDALTLAAAIVFVSSPTATSHQDAVYDAIIYRCHLPVALSCAHRHPASADVAPCGR
ncbi:hypothetical protein E2562_005198 [Oryza meyeriana var. granulata]|uniref:Uncharacterized protein n=1 Tax=Oryza meyeriana var. granulata TaxID=110450 RepID=A0A6G1BUP3_9ORYZ|nr:hypothetical protein E2562_005198 [Oryza meyeriana var. granulata]